MLATSPRVSLLVETPWLAENLDDPGLAVVDIRGSIKPPTAPAPHYSAKRDAYLEAHIPGAVFVDWTEDIVEPTASVHMTLAGPARFKALMERLGIGDEADVLVYDDSGSLAPRLWWALNYYGHDRVRLLDGGFHKWVVEGRRVTAAVPSLRPAVFTPRVKAGWRADTASVKAAMRDAHIAIVARGDRARQPEGTDPAGAERTVGPDAGGRVPYVEAAGRDPPAVRRHPDHSGPCGNHVLQRRRVGLRRALRPEARGLRERVQLCGVLV